MAKDLKGRVVLKKWTPVALWNWDVASDICPICKNNLQEPPVDLQSNGNVTAEDYSVAWGRCGHCFHLHCISRWLKMSRKVCPFCNAEWDYQTIGKFN